MIEVFSFFNSNMYIFIFIRLKYVKHFKFEFINKNENTKDDGKRLLYVCGSYLFPYITHNHDYYEQTHKRMLKYTHLNLT